MIHPKENDVFLLCNAPDRAPVRSWLAYEVSAWLTISAQNVIKKCYGMRLFCLFYRSFLVSERVTTFDVSQYTPELARCTTKTHRFPSL